MRNFATIMSPLTKIMEFYTFGKQQFKVDSLKEMKLNGTSKLFKKIFS